MDFYLMNLEIIREKKTRVKQSQLNSNGLQTER